MSAGQACRDPEHRDEWVVTMRRANRSAFNGYHLTPSAYSEVTCPIDRKRWRTRAGYVDTLPDSTPLPDPNPGET